ncbi:MAG: pyruvate dehydrogenase complex dihydrolipoamide acetyltransferase [Burkholderiaceae bacterium]|nr:pyruvate dehydrogenase complex dihydrolipoamide acetyltransferase [Burkholderiaceae bacterium]
MATLIRMPEVAANTTSAVIVAWSKNEGDLVAIGDCLAEIETEKAVIEFAADQAGVLGKILGAAGKDIDVGAPIAVLYAPGEKDVNIDALLAQEGLAIQAADEPEQQPAALASPAAQATAPVAQTGQRIFASPLARRLASDAGIDLATLNGSGPRGRIIKRDVQAVSFNVAGAPLAAVAVPVTSTAIAAAYTETPHSGMRRTIARRLSESKATIPHFYLRADCRMDSLLALRAQVNAGGICKVSVNDIIVKAVGAALRELPEMNVSWTDAALRQYSNIDIAVAVSTDTGLITPVVLGVDTKPISLIASSIVDLATRARAGKLAPHEYQGGSFTVSNLGMFGVQEFAAIINPPQAAILAVGAVEQRPVVTDGALQVASVMTVTLSVDHRAIDGSLAAKWLAVFKRIIENPLSALI